MNKAIFDNKKVGRNNVTLDFHACNWQGRKRGEIEFNKTSLSGFPSEPECLSPNLSWAWENNIFQIELPTFSNYSIVKALGFYCSP